MTSATPETPVAQTCWVHPDRPSGEEFESVCDECRENAWQWARKIGLAGYGGWVHAWLRDVAHRFDVDGPQHIQPVATSPNARPHARAACWCEPQTNGFRTMTGMPVIVHRLSPRSPFVTRN